MAKKMYIGIDDATRKIKSAYIGIDDVARKIKKGYVGVGGKARPFMSSGVAYYGTAANLTKAASNGATLVIDNKTIIGGGGDTSTYGSSTYDIYDKNLVKANPLEYVSSSGQGVRGQGNGSFGVISNGLLADYSYSNPKGYHQSYFDSNFTETIFAISDSKNEAVLCTAGEKIIIAGGGESTSSASNKVNTVSQNCVISSLADMSVGKMAGAGVMFKSRSLIYGGVYTSRLSSTKSYSYDNNLARTEINTPRADRGDSGAVVDKYAIFTGISTKSETTDVVIDENLVESAIPKIDLYYAAGISTPEFALFGGDYISGNRNVYSFDKNLVQKIEHTFSTDMVQPMGEYNNGFAIIAGGAIGSSTTSGRLNKVHAFSVPS